MGQDQSSPIVIAGRQVRMKSKIAEGGYSFVYLVEDTTSLETFALKRCIASDSHARKLIEQEIRLLEVLGSGKYPNMVRYLGSLHRESKNAREYLILMEFCSGGSVITEMQNAMDRRQRFSEEKVFKIFVSAMRALEVLHVMSPPYAHRDIKIENILISGNDYKLCDFGSCTNQAKICQSTSEIVAEQDVIERHSTLMYRAPEMCDLYRARTKQWKLSEKVDIWAMGCVMYTLLYFKHPFEDGGVLGILSGKLDFPASRLQSYSKFPAYIASRCFTVDPSLRPSASEILGICNQWHQYLKSKTIPDAVLQATLESFIPGIITGNDPTVTSNTAAVVGAASGSASPSGNNTPISTSTPTSATSATAAAAAAGRPNRPPLRPAQKPNTVVVSAAVKADDDFDVDWDDVPTATTTATAAAVAAKNATFASSNSNVNFDPFADSAPSAAHHRSRARANPNSNVVAPPSAPSPFEVTFNDNEWGRSGSAPPSVGSSSDWGAFVAGSGGSDIFALKANNNSVEAKVESPNLSVTLSARTQTPSSHAANSTPFQMTIPSPVAGSSVHSQLSPTYSTGSNQQAYPQHSPQHHHTAAAAAAAPLPPSHDIFGHFAATSPTSQTLTGENGSKTRHHFATADLSKLLSGQQSRQEAVPVASQSSTLSVDILQNPLQMLELTKSKSNTSNSNQTARATLSAIDAMYTSSNQSSSQPNYF